MIAKYPTIYHLWFLVYQRFLPPLHLHLLLHHLHHRIPSLMLTDTQENPVPEGSGGMSEELRETRCMNPQKPKNKNEGREEVQGDLLRDLVDWLQEFRGYSVDESSLVEPRRNPEQGSQDTSSSSHELPMEQRAKVKPGSGKHSVYTHFSKDPNCDICLKTKITRASCRRRAGKVVPKVENFGD